MLTTSVPENDAAALHEMYRHLHAHPELSMQEHRTAAYIEDKLSGIGIEHFRCGGTGVVGIDRNGDGPVIAFRADTDGLPIQEDTGAEYASAATGRLEDGTEVPVMHGCGHDTHVAAALTAAKLMHDRRAEWHGTVVWIFQPGEETAAGSRAMVDDGLWEKVPRPEVILGQHVFPNPAGTIGITPESTMALADSLKITVFGRQSHGSQPQDSIDPIALGVYMLNRLQSITSRELAPLDPAVVTCGTFHAGLKENIIPEKAEFTLNIRTLTDEVRAQVLAAVERIVKAEALASGAPEPLIEELYTFPRMYNDPAHTERIIGALSEELGDGKVVINPPKMGSEDFGWLGDSIGVPYVFWYFGGSDPEDPNPPVNHSPYFLPVMEPTLSTGVRAALAAIGHYLSSGADVPRSAEPAAARV
ncbi:amidohydrolase [Corynebacterium halotolerans]|uniref:Peptidase n=1 Tax=Corynebacterium halotolerans YIM 70093 = DSM 44683 TaxID=1121362 RepID=M1NNJ8_9CORY|nr:amidohydrolase [Corynebacterium halotolerans]AGF71047.1 peptidase [Corynebacterium halotolerans YIM 70093 = DSM 44683]